MPPAWTPCRYDGDEIVAEYDGANALLRRYLHGTGVDDPQIWYEGSTLAIPRSYHTNHQGSIIALAGSDGKLLAINSYDEYGIPASTNMGRFQYSEHRVMPGAS